MLKKYVVLIVAGLFVFNLKTFSFAQAKCTRNKDNCCSQHQSGSQAQDNQKKIVSAGNKFCPVLNEKIDEKNEVTYEYEGKIYNFCCPPCIEKFKKDPKKYIEKIQKENTSPNQPQRHSH